MALPLDYNLPSISPWPLIKYRSLHFIWNYTSHTDDAYDCKEVFVLCDERDVLPLVMVDQSLVDIRNVHHGLQQLEMALVSAAIGQFS